MVYFDTIGEKAHAAQREAGFAKTEIINDALLEIAHILRSSKEELARVSAGDIERESRTNRIGQSAEIVAFDDRLTEELAVMCERLTGLPTPVGTTAGAFTRPDGLRVEKLRVPVGVVGFMYENDCSAPIRAAAACIKTGNAVILRGSKESVKTGFYVADIMRTAIKRSGLEPDLIQFIDDTDPTLAMDMMRAERYIGLIIPFGSSSLVKAVRKNSSVPVLNTAVCGCMYVDSAADTISAAAIAAQSVDAGVRTCFVHRDAGESFIRRVGEKMKLRSTEVRGCGITEHILGKVRPANSTDYSGRTGDDCFAVMVVEDLAEAMENIRKYDFDGPLCVMTDSLFAADAFRSRTGSNAVYINRPASMTAGAIGTGTDIGFAAQTGPIGLEELTRIKYVIS